MTKTADHAIVLSYRSTKESMSRCEAWAAFHRKEALLPLIALGTVTGLLLGAALYQKLGLPLWLTLLVGILLGNAGWQLLNFALRGPMIQARLKTSDGTRKIESVIARDGLTEHRPEGITSYPWNLLSDFQFHEGDIFMRCGMEGLYIPREAFETTTEAERSYAMLIALHASNGERWSEFAPALRDR